MHDEVDALTPSDPDLKKPRCTIRADDHDDIVQIEEANRVAVRMQDVLIGDAVLAGAPQNHRLHQIRLP